MSGCGDSWFTSWASRTEIWHFFLNTVSIKWNRLVWPYVVRCSAGIILNSALTRMYINPDDPKGKLKSCMYQRAWFTLILAITRNFDYITELHTWRILNQNYCWIKVSTSLALSFSQTSCKECVNFTFCLLHLAVPWELPLRKPHSDTWHLLYSYTVIFLLTTATVDSNKNWHDAEVL